MLKNLRHGEYHLLSFTDARVKRLKILFISYSYWPPDFGGELLISIERLQALSTRGHNITVLTSGRPGFVRAKQEEGIEILRSPIGFDRRLGRLLRRALFWLWAIRRLRVMSFDVLHLGSMPGIGPGTDALAGWTFSRLAASKGARSLAVYSIADTEKTALNLRGLQKIWKELNFRYVDHIIAVSPALYQPLKLMFPSKAVLLPCGVRDDIFRPASNGEREEFRRQYGASTEGTVFLFLGSIGRRKGFDLLARAFADLGPKHPDWQLWVIGPRSRAESQNIVTEEVAEVARPLDGLKSRVCFWGRVDDRHQLAKILSAGDVLVFPSRREGMGIAPLEAMAVEVPAIIARIPDVTDLANIHGETGLYFNPDNLNELKEAMIQLGSNRELRKKMGKRARQVVISSFGWQDYILKWEKIYMNNVSKMEGG